MDFEREFYLSTPELLPKISPTQFTYKANLKHTRYGWLRLTPAHSVCLIAKLVEQHGGELEPVLDPFCGTGTTALVCAEKGISCDTTDINPFLVWLAKAKTYAYTHEEVQAFIEASSVVQEAVTNGDRGTVWTPALHQIEKWWAPEALQALAAMRTKIDELAQELPGPTIDLLKIAFCRVMIECANVSFGHQSMSFKKPIDALSLFPDNVFLQASWLKAVQDIAWSSRSVIARSPRMLHLDARELTQDLPRNYYGCVITSPPYPNRMSYIRELRPYMYWLGFLNSGREAGELDWKAIGGTWGCATSRLSSWIPSQEKAMLLENYTRLLKPIWDKSHLLANYIKKYFYDMAEHICELFQVMRPGGVAYYIVGNSKFYDVIVPVQEIYEFLFSRVGFEHISAQVIRKRTSKKELFEYVVSVRKPHC